MSVGGEGGVAKRQCVYMSLIYQFNSFWNEYGTMWNECRYVSRWQSLGPIEEKEGRLHATDSMDSYSTCVALVQSVQDKCYQACLHTVACLSPSSWHYDWQKHHNEPLLANFMSSWEAPKTGRNSRAPWCCASQIEAKLKSILAMFILFSSPGQCCTWARGASCRTRHENLPVKSPRPAALRAYFNAAHLQKKPQIQSHLAVAPACIPSRAKVFDRSLPSPLRWKEIFITCKRTNSANNATHNVKLGEIIKQSSKRNYYIISPRVIINPIIIISEIRFRVHFIE